MAQADDVFALAQAALLNDRARVQSICRIIAAREKEASSLKYRLEKLLNRHSSPVNSDLLADDLKKLVLCYQPERVLDDVVLDDKTNLELQAFLSEYRHADSLLEYGLSASSKLLLSGPPGNGKTSLAGAVAKELGLPFFVLDFATLIDSHLGASGAKIAKLFRGIDGIPYVLFLDEMETLLSERSGSEKRNDVGEAARIVSTLLLEMDRLSNKVILIGATNHIEMLDRAVVRRFSIHLKLNAPTEQVKSKWVENLRLKFPGIPVHTFNIDSAGLSLSDLEMAYMAECKRWVIAHGKPQASKLKTA